MLWIEMSRNESRPRDRTEWGLGRSLYTRSRKTDGSRWAFWENLLQVEKGDVILHLFGSDEPAFVGFSIAESDGYETDAFPPKDAEAYGPNETLYRVHLGDFTLFEAAYPLEALFDEWYDEIAAYYRENKERSPDQKRNILPVLHGDRLQCLNGAYLSEVEGEWREIIFEFLGSAHLSQEKKFDLFDGDLEDRTVKRVETGSQKREVEQRTGQKEFSDQVKDNYDNRCCFPECEVNDRRFLVGAHIARWADVPELRGDISNGLCLCLMHDRAFERGLFTLDSDRRVRFNTEATEDGDWAELQIKPYRSERIRMGDILPSVTALQHHWDRVGWASGCEE